MSCPGCGQRASVAFVSAHDRNRETDDRSFRYRRCQHCGTIFLSDPPEDLRPYYAAGYHGIPERAELDDHAALEQHKVDLLNRHVEPGRLTEVGPSFGAFALAAKLAGFEVTGLEMDPECCAYLRDAVGVAAVETVRPEIELEGLPPQRVVCMWHVLEHVPEPGELLRAAAAALEVGGLLAVAVPNPEALQLRLLRSRWAHLDAPRHLSLVPAGAIAAHASSAGLSLVESTTVDPFGRHCNRFGWEYALRRRPARGPSALTTRRASQVLERLAAPVERRGLNGSAITLLFRRTA